MRRNKRRFALGIAIASYILSPAIVVPSTRERDGVSLACNVAKRHLPLILASIGESLSREIENPVAAIGSSAVRAARFPRSSPSPGAPLPSPPSLPPPTSPGMCDQLIVSSVAAEIASVADGSSFALLSESGERRSISASSPLFLFPLFPLFPSFLFSFFLSFFLFFFI